MGTVYKPTFTKPLPEGAELFTRKGERFARWTDRNGRSRTARVTTPTTGEHAGTVRLLVESATYTAKYRNGADRIAKVATGCKSADAARAVLVELETRAERVRAGQWTAAEDSVLDYQATPIGEHVTAYLDELANRRGKGAKARVHTRHVATVRHRLNRIVADCRFKLLRELNRGAVERWADKREADGMTARTLNGHLAALTAFGNWCVQTGRLVANPFARPPKRDERAGRQRTRRALTDDELRRLLRVARWRPLADYGRESAPAGDKPDDPKSRKTWKRAALTFDGLDAAVERAREALAKRPDFIAELERRGRERALIYKTLVLTGLRKGELAALTVRHVELDADTSDVAYLVLDAADEKAGRGAELPLRADLAGDLRAWLKDQLDAAREAARTKNGPIPASLPAGGPLFNVPDGLVRILDRDLAAAGIPKRDERGRTVDVHALRHTFGTHLSKGGVAPRTAQAAMRHSVLDLTMNTYTDPKLLDVAGALAVLPTLPLDDDGREAQQAYGTYGRTLVPLLVPNPEIRSTAGAIGGGSSGVSHSARDAVSAGATDASGPWAGKSEQRATRLERATFSLEG